MTWLSKFGTFAKKAAPFTALIPGVGPLVAGGIGLAGEALSRTGGGGSGGAPTSLGSRYDAALRGEPLPGAGLESVYDKRASAFDPAASVDTYARGAWDSIYGGVGGVRDTLRDLKGSAVGAGRLDSGFFDEDQGTVINRALQGLGSSIAQQSVSAAGLDLRNIEGMGATGEARGTRYLDLLSGGMDRQTAEENARRQRQADTWGSLFEAGGRVAGSYLGRRPAVAAAV